MSFWKRGGKPGDSAGDAVPEAGAAGAASLDALASVDAAAAPTATAATAPFAVPRWLRMFGYASWLIIGVVVVLLGVGAMLSAWRTIVIPTLFAILLGATFMPVVDRLEKWHVKRWMGAILVMVLIVIGAVALLFIIIKGLIEQGPTIVHQVDAGIDWIIQWLEEQGISTDFGDSIKKAIDSGGAGLFEGVVGTAVKGVESVISLFFGIFIALNILVYVLMDGRRIGRWASAVAKPVPQPVAYDIVRNSARFFRGYIWGSTLVGLFNGIVMAIGAVVIGVPLAATIGIIGWATNYIPMFGAFIGGAFAVIIALGVGGWQKALWMLIVVLIANGPLQTVVSQFALGSSLNLNGLVVLFSTTIGAIAAGAIGGVFAAPFTKIGIDTYHRLKDAGMFEDARYETPLDADARRGARGSGPPGSGAGPPLDAGPPGEEPPGMEPARARPPDVGSPGDEAASGDSAAGGPDLPEQLTE